MEAAMLKPRLFDLLDHFKRIPQIVSLYERGERIEYIGAVVGVHPSSERKSRNDTGRPLANAAPLSSCSLARLVDIAKLEVLHRRLCAAMGSAREISCRLAAGLPVFSS